MEPLVLGILALALPLLMIVTGLAINSLALLLGGFLRLTIGRKKSSPVTDSQEPENQTSQSAQLRKRPTGFMKLCAGLLSLMLVSLALGNAFFFEQMNRWALNKVENRAGLIINFDSAQGSLWTGTFRFQGLTASRADHPKGVFDFKVDSIAVDISMRDLIRHKIVFEEISVTGVTGSLEQREKTPKTEKPDIKKKRRAFMIRQLNLADIRLDYHSLASAIPVKTAFHLEHLQAAPLSSRFLICDLLFGAQAKGSINGLDFVINNQPTEDGRASTWRCANLSLPLLSSVLGGPFQWFTEGEVNVLVENNYRQSELEMNWGLVMQNFKMVTPKGTSALMKASLGPVMTYMNSKNEHLDLTLRISLTPDDLSFASTTDLVDLIRTALGQAMFDELNSLKDKFVKWRSSKKDKAEEKQPESE